MPYTPTVWSDEIPASTPVKYKITDDVSGEVAGSAAITVVTSVTLGTPLNATNMNKIEAGIEDATDTAEAAEIAATSAQADATEALKFAQPVLYAVKTTSQSIPHATYTKLTGWVAAIVARGGVSFNESTGDISLPAGKYLVETQSQWDVNATGVREMTLQGISSGGAVGIFKKDRPALTDVPSFGDGEFYLPVATTLNTSIYVWQNSGGTLNMTNAAVKITRIED